MGTRADYYTFKNNQFTWLGSTAWDGYPKKKGVAYSCINKKTKTTFIKAVKSILAKNNGILPSEPWPWPWETSATTDYAYIFNEDESKVHILCFGEPHRKQDIAYDLPDMTQGKEWKLSPKDSIMVFTLKGASNE